MSKNTSILFALIMAAMVINSCASEQSAKVSSRLPDDEPFKIDTIINTREAVTTAESKPIFTYNESPLMSYDGGLKLRGIIYGTPSIAVIEVVDRSINLEVGQQVCGYKLSSIAGNTAVFYKNKKKITLEML